MSTTETFNRTVADLKDNVASATEAYQSVSEKAAKSTSDVAAFNQGTLEAFASAGQILANESQALAREYMQVGQTAVTEGLASFRAIITAKSIKEGLELQANFVRTASIWSVNECARLARAGIDLAEKVSAPVLARAQLAAEKASSYSV